MSKLIDQIQKNEGRNSYHYRFYTCNGTHSGRVREIGDDFVRIRLNSDGDGGYTDKLIAMDNVCAVKKTFSRE